MCLFIYWLMSPIIYLLNCFAEAGFHYRHTWIKGVYKRPSFLHTTYTFYTTYLLHTYLHSNLLISKYLASHTCLRSKECVRGDIVCVCVICDVWCLYICFWRSRDHIHSTLTTNQKPRNIKVATTNHYCF